MRKAGKLMYDVEKKTILRLHLTMTFLIAPMILCCCVPSRAQQVSRGTIKGTVTADQGEVRGFRVAAHNLDHRLWYTVFTVKGHYTVPQALPGRYEVMVYEPDYDSPKEPVQLGPGENKTADLAVKKRQAAASDPNIEYVDSMEEVYPPGPGRDLMKENCTGCHADQFGRMHYTREKFMQGIEKMTETGPGYNKWAIALPRTIIPKSQKEMLADYMVKNFGPGTVDKRVRIDPLVLDEDVFSKAIYVGYEIPADMQFVSAGDLVGADMVDGVTAQWANPEKYHHMGAAFISPKNGDIYFTNRSSSAIMQLNPRDSDPSEQWKTWRIKGSDYVHPSGLTVDKQGHVWWAELRGGMLGELDPETGKQIRHALPELAGAVHEVVIDKDGNIDFDLIWGAFFGRLDATTRRIHMYSTPTPDNGMYGLAVDQHDNAWGAGWQKGTISEWQVETESVKEYKVPNSWGQVRRITVDSKGIVWATEHNVGLLARLDPATGALTEYKIPVNGAQPYEAWADRDDNIWIADSVHSAMLKFDQKSSKFTFYPMPQPHQSIQKIQVADDNTIWLPTRGEPICTGVHFYPNGYTANAPPEP